MTINMAYEKEINALIPIAEKEAKRKVMELGMKSANRPGIDGATYNYSFFTEYFHEAMNRLAIEAGLRTF